MKYRLVTFLIVVLSGGHGFPQEDSQASSSSTSDALYLEPEREESRGRPSGQQSFYPSFAPFQHPPLGHSRPFFFQQEAAYSQRPHAGYQQLSYEAPRLAGYKDSGYRAAANSESRGLLGSGNFGVLRGGTFYDKEADNYDYTPFFRNGHGRPSYYQPNPRPYQHEQFENFRDFADINTPSNSAYSHYVVVYVNKNSTERPSAQRRPKNIIESLALLDLESTPPPPRKVSKVKAKLAKVMPEKKSRGPKAARELREPLLALS